MWLILLIFLFILSLLVFVHELGHFWACRIFGVRVEEFGLGFPPRIFRIKTKATVYSLNLIPFGGFVKIKGEEGAAKKDDRESFANRPIWQRFVITISGVLMNIVLTIVLFSFGFVIGFPLTFFEEKELANAKIKNQHIQIIKVIENSPAQKEEILPGDIVLEVDKEKVSQISDFQRKIKEKKGEEVLLKIQRLDKIIEKKISLQEKSLSEQTHLGVFLAQKGIVSFTWYKAILMAGKITFSLIGQFFLTLYEIIKNWIIGKPVPLEVTGPVGIAYLTSQMFNLGFIYLLQFTAFLSLNLAIINVLPFPALDGGRILFLGIEKMRGKRDEKIENLIHTLGFLFLISLMVFITFKDVARFREKLIGILERIF